MTLTGEGALVFLLADAQTSRSRIERAVREMIPESDANVDALIDGQIRAGVMVEVGRRLIGVVPFERPRVSRDLTAWITRWLGLPAEVPA